MCLSIFKHILSGRTYAGIYLDSMAVFLFLLAFLVGAESTYVSLHEKQFVNRGFIRGPFSAVVWNGALMMLIVSMPFQDNLILTYVAGCVGATVLEYITGVLMETLFKVRYWDYSHKNSTSRVKSAWNLRWHGDF